MKVQNVVELKQENVKNIIKYVRHSSELTKKEIVGFTGLSFATVSNICNELKFANFIEEVDVKGNHSVGRNPKKILLRYNEFFILCMDFHIKNTVRMAIMNLRGETVSECNIGIDNYCNLEEFIQKSFVQFRHHVVEKKIEVEKIIGMGVIVSGIFDTSTELIVASELELFENQPLKETLIKIYNMPVYIDNESNLCASAMYLNQSGKEYHENIIYLYIAEGLGVGIIAHGNLLSGEKGYAAEICHIPIGSRKYKCRLCNNYGCVETDLSIYGFVAKYSGVYKYDKDLVFKEWNSFVKAVKNNEQKALQVLQENGVILGYLLSILVNVFNPGVVYIGGMVTPIFDEIIDFARNEVKCRVIDKARNIDIICDNMGAKRMFSGACEMVFNKWMPLY